MFESQACDELYEALIIPHFLSDFSNHVCIIPLSNVNIVAPGNMGPLSGYSCRKSSSVGL